MVTKAQPFARQAERRGGLLVDKDNAGEKIPRLLMRQRLRRVRQGERPRRATVVSADDNSRQMVPYCARR